MYSPCTPQVLPKYSSSTPQVLPLYFSSILQVFPNNSPSIPPRDQSNNHFYVIYEQLPFMEHNLGSKKLLSSGKRRASKKNTR